MTFEVKNSLVNLVETFVSESPKFKHYTCRVETYDVNQCAVIVKFERIFHIDDFNRLSKFVKDYNLSAFIGVGYIDIQ